MKTTPVSADQLKITESEIDYILSILRHLVAGGKATNHTITEKEITTALGVVRKNEDQRG